VLFSASLDDHRVADLRCDWSAGRRGRPFGANNVALDNRGRVGSAAGGQRAGGDGKGQHDNLAAMIPQPVQPGHAHS